MFNFTIFTGLADQQLKTLMDRMDGMQKELTKLMADLQTSLDAVDKVTTEMGGVLAEEGSTLKIISDNQDALLAAIKNGTVTPAQIAQAEAHNAALSAVSSNLKAIADLSKGIANKGVIVPPTPVPSPTPVPAPSLP